MPGFRGVGFSGFRGNFEARLCLASGFREIPSATARAAARKLKRNAETGGEAAGRKPEMPRAAKCDRILSEDMNDGQRYCGILARNPF